MPRFVLGRFRVGSATALHLIEDPLVSGIEPLVADGCHGPCQRDGNGKGPTRK